MSKIGIYLVLVIINLQKVFSDCPPNLKLLCYEQTNCGECIQAHPCCNWCYDQKQDFTGKHRCNFLEELKECGDNIETNIDAFSEIIKDNDFTQIRRARDASRAIQMKPQSFRVVLRKDRPVNLTFTYKSAKNYPLELYYLGDLSYSMRTHLETLKNLGDDLGKSLENLTLNYRLAYGSFLDKPGMPFFYSDEKNMKNPCQTDKEKCEQGYLFKHRLNFTSKIDRFFEQVRNSKISANVDDLDGALEAIFQILVCDKKFGWSEYSRKIILLSTDSLLHSAGDGILAGASLLNDNLCLVNEKGDHIDPLKYDYPSVGQIKSLLRQHKVNLIVAVTKDKIEPYKKMEKDILEQEAFVGELQESSSNILELVSTGFYDFIRQVDFSANTSHAPELEVKFFGDCYGIGDFNDTSGCQNVQEETPMYFKVQISLKEWTTKTSEQIFIREKNINEAIEINTEYVSSTCNCQNYEKTGEEPECVNGAFSCGTCMCEKGWTGSDCSKECVNTHGACRAEEGGNTCSGRGECICSKCDCTKPFVGEFCQFECPTDKYDNICGGHGTCLKGVCACAREFEGEDCSCEKAINKCKLTETGSICNGHGYCKCNKCTCEDGYTGTYCEKTKNTNSYCIEYEDQVKSFAEKDVTHFQRNDIDIMVKELTDDETCEDDCSVVYFTGGVQRCFLDYCYHKGANHSIILLTKNKRCIASGKALGAGLALGVFFAILLGGLIMIIFKKIQIYRADKAEYEKFKNTSNSWNEMNPIYKSPVTEFKNPMAK